MHNNESRQVYYTVTSARALIGQSGVQIGGYFRLWSCGAQWMPEDFTVRRHALRLQESC